MKGGKKRPAKRAALLEAIKAALDEGRVRDVTHAMERQEERAITRPEYFHVLRSGYHEARKDEWKEEYQAWNYAIRGKTVDERGIRVAVSFEQVKGKSGETLLIITVIGVDDA